MWIDLVLPVRRVLEIYLNIAEWGRTASSVWRRRAAGL
jgi:membrane peptidoglycan carboxypeptidase